jgi:hypothetical protein
MAARVPTVSVRLLLEEWPDEGTLADIEVEGEIERLRSLVDAFARPPRLIAQGGVRRSDGEGDRDTGHPARATRRA